MRPVRPSRSRSHPARRLFALLVACVLTLSMAGANVQADSYDERRVRAGARVFRAMLAADTAIEQRRGADGRLHVLLYAADTELADEIGALIAPKAKGAVRGLPLTVQSSAQLPAEGSEVPAGMFLASIPSDAELDRLVRWSIANKVLVYSPFEGHVERGVAGGISIEAKVQPYVNASTLKAAGVELKPLFLTVAKVHP
jgi:hypothetical protein